MGFLDSTGLSHLWSKILAVIPSSLPNPQKLTINGTEYDGSTAVDVTVSGGSGGGGLSSIVAGTGAGSEIFNQDENNTLDPTTVTGSYSHIEGKNNTLITSTAETDGYNNGGQYVWTQEAIHLEGENNTSYGGYYGHVEGYNNIDYGRNNHIEGSNQVVNKYHGYGGNNHVEGSDHYLPYRHFAAHLEGYKHHVSQSAVANGASIGIHIEGSQHTIVDNNKLIGEGTHIEGCEIKIRSTNSTHRATHSGLHVEGGFHTLSAGGSFCGHIEGGYHTGYLSQSYLHIEGGSNSVNMNLGNGSHIEGCNHQVLPSVLTNTVHIEGYNNGSPGCSYQHIQGYFADTSNAGQLAHIVGNGSATARSNAHTLDWDGNAWYEGTVEPEGGLILHSSTPDSTKKVLITVDDSGTLSATEIVAS